MKRHIVGLIILVLVVVICGGLIGFNIFRQKMITQFFANFPVPTVTVSTTKVEPKTWTPGIDAIGTVSAAQGVNVAGQVAGVVKAIDFKANDDITAGQLLVQLDDSVDRAGLAAAKSTLAVSQDALARTEKLFKSNFATSADLQAAQNKLDQAKGALDQIEATLAQKAIRAPFAGTVGIPKIDVGQYLQTGTAIATLQDLSKMRVDFTVPEQQLGILSIGQAVSVGLGEGNLDLGGEITGIDPKIDSSSHLISVQAVVDNSKRTLRPGQFVRIRVHLPKEDNVIAVPQTTVVLSLYGNYVYEVVPAPQKPGADSGNAAAGGTGADKKPAGPQLIAKQIFVQTGRRLDTEIEIIKGLKAGAEIVSSGQNKLSNGSHVAVDNSVNPADAQAKAAADASR